MKKLVITLLTIFGLLLIEISNAAWILPGGEVIRRPVKTVINGHIFKKKWFSHPNVPYRHKKLNQFGIKLYIDVRNYNPRFYSPTTPVITEQPGPVPTVIATWNFIPRYSLIVLKNRFKAQIISGFKERLQNTNYHIFNYVESGTTIPPTVVTERAENRVRKTTMFSEITAETDYDILTAYQITW